MRLLKLLLVLSVCLCVSVVAFAHSGKTDAIGGHINHSSGEYHYHHGYPAHQHSDMDGDGELDCPYYFEDKTGLLSGNSGSSSESPTEPTAKPEPAIEENTAPEKPEVVSEKSKTFFDHVWEVASLLLDILCCLLFGWYCLSAVFWIINEIKR